MLNTYTLEYTTDTGKEVGIQLKMQPTNANQRLSAGGFPTNNNNEDCFFTVPRRRLTPRYVDHKTLGRIFFRTHALWVQYINNSNNAKNIISVAGERYTCFVVGL